LLDQVTKAAVIRKLPVGASWPSADTWFTRFFSFTHVENTGVSFGKFQGLGTWYALVPLSVVAGVLVYRRRLPDSDVWLNVASGLIVAGALGNVIDRLHIGHVTDFLDFKVWPVFNVADTSVFLGVVMITIHVWQTERAERKARQLKADIEAGSAADLEAEVGD
jgi:signal peptidase II